MFWKQVDLFINCHSPAQSNTSWIPFFKFNILYLARENWELCITHFKYDSSFLVFIWFITFFWSKAKFVRCPWALHIIERERKLGHFMCERMKIVQESLFLFLYYILYKFNESNLIILLNFFSKKKCSLYPGEQCEAWAIDWQNIFSMLQYYRYP